MVKESDEKKFFNSKIFKNNTLLDQKDISKSPEKFEESAPINLNIVVKEQERSETFQNENKTVIEYQIEKKTEINVDYNLMEHGIIMKYESKATVSSEGKFLLSEVIDQTSEPFLQCFETKPIQKEDNILYNVSKGNQQLSKIIEDPELALNPLQNTTMYNIIQFNVEKSTTSDESIQSVQVKAEHKTTSGNKIHEIKLEMDIEQINDNDPTNVSCFNDLVLSNKVLISNESSEVVIKDIQEIYISIESSSLDIRSDLEFIRPEIEESTETIVKNDTNLSKVHYDVIDPNMGKNGTKKKDTGKPVLLTENKNKIQTCAIQSWLKKYNKINSKSVELQSKVKVPGEKTIIKRFPFDKRINACKSMLLTKSNNPLSLLDNKMKYKKSNSKEINKDARKETVETTIEKTIISGTEQEEESESLILSKSQTEDSEINTSNDKNKLMVVKIEHLETNNIITESFKKEPSLMCSGKLKGELDIGSVIGEEKDSIKKQKYFESAQVIENELDKKFSTTESEYGTQDDKIITPVVLKKNSNVGNVGIDKIGNKLIKVEISKELQKIEKIEVILAVEHNPNDEIIESVEENLLSITREALNKERSLEVIENVMEVTVIISFENKKSIAIKEKCNFIEENKLIIKKSIERILKCEKLEETHKLIKEKIINEVALLSIEKEITDERENKEINKMIEEENKKGERSLELFEDLTEKSFNEESFKNKENIIVSTELVILTKPPPKRQRRTSKVSRNSEIANSEYSFQWFDEQPIMSISNDNSQNENKVYNIDEKEVLFKLKLTNEESVKEKEEGRCVTNRNETNVNENVMKDLMSMKNEETLENIDDLRIETANKSEDGVVEYSFDWFDQASRKECITDIQNKSKIDKNTTSKVNDVADFKNESINYKCKRESEKITRNNDINSAGNVEVNVRRSSKTVKEEYSFDWFNETPKMILLDEERSRKILENKNLASISKITNDEHTFSVKQRNSILKNESIENSRLIKDNIKNDSLDNSKDFVNRNDEYIRMKKDSAKFIEPISIKSENYNVKYMDEKTNKDNQNITFDERTEKNCIPKTDKASINEMDMTFIRTQSYTSIKKCVTETRTSLTPESLIPDSKKEKNSIIEEEKGNIKQYILTNATSNIEPDINIISDRIVDNMNKITFIPEKLENIQFNIVLNISILPDQWALESIEVTQNDVALKNIDNQRTAESIRKNVENIVLSGIENLKKEAVSEILENNKKNHTMQGNVNEKEIMISEHVSNLPKENISIALDFNMVQCALTNEDICLYDSFNNEINDLKRISKVSEKSSNKNRLYYSHSKHSKEEITIIQPEVMKYSSKSIESIENIFTDATLQNSILEEIEIFDENNIFVNPDVVNEQCALINVPQINNESFNDETDDELEKQIRVRKLEKNFQTEQSLSIKDENIDQMLKYYEGVLMIEVNQSIEDGSCLKSETVQIQQKLSSIAVISTEREKNKEVTYVEIKDKTELSLTISIEEENLEDPNDVFMVSIGVKENKLQMNRIKNSNDVTSDKVTGSNKTFTTDGVVKPDKNKYAIVSPSDKVQVIHKNDRKSFRKPVKNNLVDSDKYKKPRKSTLLDRNCHSEGTYNTYNNKRKASREKSNLIGKAACLASDLAIELKLNILVDVNIKSITKDKKNVRKVSIKEEVIPSPISNQTIEKERIFLEHLESAQFRKELVDSNNVKDNIVPSYTNVSVIDFTMENSESYSVEYSFKKEIISIDKDDKQENILNDAYLKNNYHDESNKHITDTFTLPKIDFLKDMNKSELLKINFMNQLEESIIIKKENKIENKSQIEINDEETIASELISSIPISESEKFDKPSFNDKIAILDKGIKKEKKENDLETYVSELISTTHLEKSQQIRIVESIIKAPELTQKTLNNKQKNPGKRVSIIKITEPTNIDNRRIQEQGYEHERSPNSVTCNQVQLLISDTSENLQTKLRQQYNSTENLKKSLSNQNELKENGKISGQLISLSELTNINGVDVVIQQLSKYLIVNMRSDIPQYPQVGYTDSNTESSVTLFSLNLEIPFESNNNPNNCEGKGTFGIENRSTSADSLSSYISSLTDRDGETVSKSSNAYMTSKNMDSFDSTSMDNLQSFVSGNKTCRNSQPSHLAIECFPLADSSSLATVTSNKTLEFARINNTDMKHEMDFVLNFTTNIINTFPIIFDFTNYQCPVYKIYQKETIKRCAEIVKFENESKKRNVWKHVKSVTVCSFELETKENQFLNVFFIIYMTSIVSFIERYCCHIKSLKLEKTQTKIRRHTNNLNITYKKYFYLNDIYSTDTVADISTDYESLHLQFLQEPSPSLTYEKDIEVNNKLVSQNLSINNSSMIFERSPDFILNKIQSKLLTDDTESGSSLQRIMHWITRSKTFPVD